MLKNESETLFIPLLGKALMSKKNLFLEDLKALEIVSKVDYDFDSLKQSKWLSMFLSLRTSIIDKLCNKFILEHSNVTVIHLGCGLDSRVLRVNQNFNIWYDIDYENVIEIRKQFYDESPKYKMIGSSILDFNWLNQINNLDNILIVMEGLTMYLEETEIKELIDEISNKFENVYLIFDAYSKFGVKCSKIKNPVNQMNAQIKYGFNSPKEFLLLNKKLKYVSTHLIKRDNNKLSGVEKFIFNNLYCGKISQSLYKIYEFKLKEN